MNLYIGLISGTSVDGIDSALVDFSEKFPALISTHLHPIPSALKQQVFNLANPRHDEINQIAYLDNKFGKLFSQAALELCQQNGIDPSRVTAIGCHGQTVRHLPPLGERVGYSLQIGDPNIIAQLTGITTIADFRRRDLAAGGHGAPLAPAFHNSFFRSTKTNRIILNMGGIANITWLPAEKTAKVIGYDTGPANGLMDCWCQKHRGEDFDRDGLWAQSGKSVEILLQKLLLHPFFSLKPPKSTGREDFNLSWLEKQLQDLPRFSKADVQATLLSFTVETIIKEINLCDPKLNCEVYICGGGAYNKVLFEALEIKLSPRRVEQTEALGVPANWVEAATFAWLAKQRLQGLPGNLPSVTGARNEVLLGGIY